MVDKTDKGKKDDKTDKDDDLSELTEEERAELAAEADEKDAAEKAAADAAEKAAADADAGKKDGEKDAAEKAAADADEAPSALNPFTPKYGKGEKVDLDKELVEITDGIKELRTKRDGGDLSLSEFDEQHDVLEGRRWEVRTALDRLAMDAESVQQSWHRAQDEWGAKPENARFMKGVLFGAMNAAIAANNAAGENLDKPYAWHLDKARRDVEKAMGLKPADEGDPDAPERGADTVIAKTLGDLPAAAENETGAKPEFEELDSLEATDLEVRLATMPESKVEEYLKWGNDRDIAAAAPGS